MQFEWDDVKNRKNIKKHGIAFEEAVRVFLDPNTIYLVDESGEEPRWDAIGIVEKVMFVVFTERDNDTLRIISARKATKEEIHEYQKNVFGRG